MNLFSERLREVRIMNDKTQKETAVFMGINERSYQKYEYQEREPSFDSLIKLCKYFNVSSDYLLGLDNEQIVNKQKEKSF